MNQLTKEQIQWLWEQCGLKYEYHEFAFGGNARCSGCYLNGEYERRHIPKVDFSNLFRYAVPKLIQKIGKSRTAFVLQHWVHEVAMHDEDPALALSWAIYNALGGKEW